jgi:hypothetical protein
VWVKIAALTLILGLVVLVPDSWGHEFKRVLRRRSHGKDVRALEKRVAAWFPSAQRTRLVIDRYFGARTERAVKRFQRHYDLTVDGIAGPQTFRKLASLEDRDGSTAHFDWPEFVQKRHPSCSRRANSFAGTFRGGRLRVSRTRRNVKRLMWRLEAIRAKAGNQPVRVTSGFRSVPYNRCVGGGRLSQHLYGLAVDINIAGVNAHRERKIARRSQIHGIVCSSSYRHNHLDLRIENPRLGRIRYWWWPERDRRGRDLSSNGRPCLGEPHRR